MGIQSTVQATEHGTDSPTVFVASIRGSICSIYQSGCGLAMWFWYWTLSPAQRNDVYGSTGASVTLREANRMSVLRKLEQGQEVQVELAIRYWHQNSCFQLFTLIKIASCDSFRAAWTLEQVKFPKATKTQFSVCSSLSEADCIRIPSCSPTALCILFSFWA